MIANFTRKRIGFPTTDIRGIADDKIELEWQKGVEQMRFQEADASGKPKPFGIAPRYVQCCAGNVTRVDDGGGQLLRERQSDAAGARADIDDGDAFA